MNSNTNAVNMEALTSGGFVPVVASHPDGAAGATGAPGAGALGVGGGGGLSADAPGAGAHDAGVLGAEALVASAPGGGVPGDTGGQEANGGATGGPGASAASRLLLPECVMASVKNSVQHLQKYIEAMTVDEKGVLDAGYNHLGKTLRIVEPVLTNSITAAVTDIVAPLHNRLSAMEVKMAELGNVQIPAIDQKLDAATSNLWSETALLWAQLEFKDQESRAFTLKMHGVEKTQGEDTKEVVIDLIRVLNVHLDRKDISKCYRLPERDNKSGIQFTVNDEEKFRKILETKRELKEKKPGVIIFESLTGPRNALLHKLKNDDRVEKTWTYGARLKVLLKNEAIAHIPAEFLDAVTSRGRLPGERILVVNHLEQLNKLLKVGWSKCEVYDLIWSARRKEFAHE